MPDITKRKLPPPPPPKLGDTKVIGGWDYTFVGDTHPLTQGAKSLKGWARTNRLAAYQANDGIARCAYSTPNSPDVSWADIRVVDDQSLCPYHGRVRSFGKYLMDQGEMTPTIGRELLVLSQRPCRIEGPKPSEKEDPF